MANWDKNANFETEEEEKEEEFQENEVWDLMTSTTTSPTKPRKHSQPGSTSSTNRFTNPRPVPKSFNPGSPIQGGSARVEVPDWSKIYKKKDTCRVNNHAVDDDEDDVMVPPHEFLARRLQSTRIASYSMCEGVGRTLKGRDLSKLRNAILTKTGFLE